MKSGIPWNLKGVDAETREAVIAAARRAGMSVGDWLDQVLAADGEGYAEPEETIAPRKDAPPTLTSAIAQIKNRLEEIERSVARASDRRPAAPPPARAQKSVQEMVAELAREIENPDESARSMIEGLGLRRETPAPRAPEPGPLSDVIRNLDQRLANMGPRATTPPAAETRPRLDDIRYHLNALLAQAPKPKAPEPAEPAGQATLIDAALRALESRIDDARAKVAEREAQTESAAATAEHIARVETRLAEISERLNAADGERNHPSQKDAELAAAIREIAVHQRTLDDRAETSAIRRDQKALAAAMAALRTDIAALAEQVGTISRVGSEEHGAFFDLASRIDMLAAERPVNRDMLAAIHGDLDTLRGMIETGPATSGLDRSRLDELGREMVAMRHALEADDSPRAIQRLEMRVAELARALEAAFSHRQPSPPRDDRALERLEGRIADIAGQINTLRDRGGEADAIASVEQRLEGRLNDIANRLAGGLMDTTSHAAAIETAQQRLENRLEDIFGRLGGMFEDRPGGTSMEHIHERLHAITERIDALNATPREPSAALDAVKAEIGALRADLAGQAAPAAMANTDHLEEQIRALAVQLETVTTRSADSSALAELEDRVATLATELEHAPRADTLHQVESSLERLQTLLADTTRESIAGARAEARKAVTELSEVVALNEIDTDLVRGLMRDLDALKSAVSTPDEAVKGELQSVGDTLTQVVERLTRLEREANTAVGRGSATSSETIPAVRVDLPASAARRPAAKAETPSQATPETAAPARKAAEQRADFIAAARRAAQAASARIATETKSETTAAPDVASDPAPAVPPATRKPGPFARIGQAVRNRRRPLLLAAAAIVLAIGAMQVYGRLQSTGREPPPLISATETVVPEATSQFRDVAAAAPLPTVPQAAEAAMIAPAATPDVSLAFAAPAAEPDRFGGTPSAPDAAAFAPQEPAPLQSQTIAGAAAAEAAAGEPVTLASAAPAGPPPGAASGLDARMGSEKLLAAADNGDPAAAFEIATRFAEGTVVRKDLAKAAEWYSRAAEGGVAVAQYRLGSLYERGQGVSRDLVSAVNWYQRAADQGNVNAMHNLAVLMSEGVEGPADHDKALQWFLAAGNYGVRDSQYNLGVIYARALGPEQDLVESYKWFAIAASQGDKDAAERRDEVAKAMTPDDLARARAAVTAWHVKPPLAEANGVSAPGGGWDGPGEMLGEADRQALVRKIQVLLAEQGFDPGPADGMVGPKTVEAVRAYQREVGQPATGEIDNSLVAALADAPM